MQVILPTKINKHTKSTCGKRGQSHNTLIPLFAAEQIHALFSFVSWKTKDILIPIGSFQMILDTNPRGTLSRFRRIELYQQDRTVLEKDG